MGPLEKTAQASLDHKRLRDIIEAVETCALFVLDDQRRVQLCNKQARDLAGDVDLTDWLQAARFHTIADKRLLEGEDAPINRCFGQGVAAPLVAGWLDPRGGEHVFEFRGTKLGGLSVLTLQDCTQLWDLRRTLAEMPGPSPGHDPANLPGIAHDLGNILGTLQLALGNLERLDLPDKAQHHLHDLLEACARGNAVLDSLFDPGTVGEASPSPVDVAEFLRTKSHRIARVLPRAVSLRLDLPEDPCLCRCRKNELELALISMVGYVREAVLEGSDRVGAVVLELRARAGMIDVEIAAADGGSSARLPLDIHDSYFTRDRAMRSGGVGLVVAERFARHAGGTLKILQAEGEELRLVLSLPQTVASESSTDTRQSGSDLYGYRVLLAERDTHLRKLLTESLRQFGAEVAAVSNGEDAIYIMERERAPDVLVTNPSFPDGTTSKSLERKIARDHPAVRMIVTSGSPDAPAGLDLGGSMLFLRKPVQIEMLRNAILLRPPGKK